ncbi:unnamed protein product, partial [Rhizoctonia solani]
LRKRLGGKPAGLSSASREPVYLVTSASICLAVPSISSLIQLSLLSIYTSPTDVSNMGYKALVSHTDSRPNAVRNEPGEKGIICAPDCQRRISQLVFNHIIHHVYAYNRLEHRFRGDVLVVNEIIILLSAIECIVADSIQYLDIVYNRLGHAPRRPFKRLLDLILSEP